MKDLRSILFISDGSHWGEIAAEFLRERFSQVDWLAWDHGTPQKRAFDEWTGCDILLSFKSDFIIPEWMLNRVRETAINFHPSIPQYRGIGGYRYAIDSAKEEFGVTCHFITPDLDAGPIIEVTRFPISNRMTERELRERTAEVALEQFQRIAVRISKREPLKANTNETWGTRLHTRVELEEYRQNAHHRTDNTSPAHHAEE